MEHNFTRINLKKKLMSLLIIAAVILTAALILFLKGYANARDKYVSTIQELEAEVERLSDPAAVYEEATKEIDIRVINADIQSIGELATIEYLYTDAGKFEDPAELFGKEIPFSFTTKSFIAKWDGSIKAGVDITKVTAEANDTTKEILIHIPEAKILSHEIQEESIETLDEKNGLFNQIKVEDIREFDAISKDAMEQRAIDNGILDKAFENAKEIIRQLVHTELVEELEYTITFEVMEE